MKIDNSIYQSGDDLHGLAVECAIRGGIISRCKHGSLIRQINDDRIAVEKILMICVNVGAIVPSFREFQKNIMLMLDQATVHECSECIKELGL